MTEKQVIIVIRGAPATGKTVIARRLRHERKKTVWLGFDVIRSLIYKEPRKRKKGLVFETLLALAEFFLKKRYSVVIEEIFIKKRQIDPFFKLGKKLKIPVYLFELRAQTKDLLSRNPDREYTVAGGQEAVKRINKLVLSNPDKRAIIIDTSKCSSSNALSTIRKEIGDKI